MLQRITIIGGLEEDIDRTALLEQLRDRTGNDIEWDWVKAEPLQWNAPTKAFKKLLGQFRSNRPGVELPTIVKLHLLHGRDQDQIHSAKLNPILAPRQVQSVESLIEWLFSAKSGLIPRTEWYGCLSEAALAALFSKLLKNKSWNKDTQGHAWTKEADLIGQAPVHRPGFEAVRAEAEELLRMADGLLFLSKGGKQGKTPKEWCIKVEHVPLVKCMILERDFSDLTQVAALNAIHRRVTREDHRKYRIDGEITNERVLHICRS